MNKLLGPIAFAMLVLSLSACGDDDESVDLASGLRARAGSDRALRELGERLQNAPEMRKLAEEGRRVAPLMQRSLEDGDIELWCAVESAAREARGGRDPLTAAADMQAARRSVCQARDVTLMQYQLVNARLRVALMHLDRNIPATDQKKGDVDTVRRLRDRIREVQSR